MDLVVGDAVIACDIVHHPLLGDAFVICDRSGEPLTAMSAIDLDRPTEIPIIAEPATLPPGSGALLLNLIAERAPHPLRYGGPYNTPALYRALLRSFTASASEEVFCTDVLDRAIRRTRDEIPVEFTPAPHRRITFPAGFAEVRDRVERAVIDGVTYDVVDGRAEVRFGDRVYAHVATFDATGLVDGPHPIPPLANAIIGSSFPSPLRAAIADVVADLVPDPLAADARRIVADRELVWADLGARLARATPTGFAVHAGIWQLVGPSGLAQVAITLAEALAPIVSQTIVREVSRPSSS